MDNTFKLLRYLCFIHTWLKTPEDKLRQIETCRSFDGLYVKKIFVYNVNRGMRWRSWLRHCATSRKVAGSIPDSVFGIFHWHNRSGRRNISWRVTAASA